MQNAQKGLFGSPDGSSDLSSWQFGDQGFDPSLLNVGVPALPPSAGASGDSTVAIGDLGVLHGSNSGGSSGSITSGSSAAPAATLVTTAGSGLEFNLVWDSSVASAPAGFMSDVIAAAKFYESQITTTAVVNLDVGYGEIGGGTTLSSGALGESESYLVEVPYTSLVADLKATASTDATDAAFLASLPATAPVSGDFWVTTAQAKALGIVSATDTAVDGDIGFGTSSEFTYGDTNSTGTVAAGTYDFFATAAHEMSEVMGRLLLVGSTSVNGTAGYTLLDLAHYSAAGTRDFTQTTPGYFSVNGGTTNDGEYNDVSGGDPGDWASPSTGQANPVVDDSYDAYATPGVLEPVSANDLVEDDAMGWNLGNPGTTAPAPVPTPPTGVSITLAESSLSGLQGTSGLAGGKTVATFTEVGGVSGDKFSYTLGGTNAASFAISSSGVLTTASAGVAGAANGKLYELTVTANDITNASTTVSAPAQAVNVVVGSSGADTITLSSLSGIVAAAPTFIYGLAGNDKIVGTGMTGSLYFDGGAGADTMTGGSGTNIYEFAATSDSTPSAMDIITNFKVATDKLDFTGISSKFTTLASLATTATQVAADSIEWQVSGGNTYVYANTTSKAEAFASATMKIELQGTVALTTANFAHN